MVRVFEEKYVFFFRKLTSASVNIYIYMCVCVLKKKKKGEKYDSNLRFNYAPYTSLKIFQIHSLHML